MKDYNLFQEQVKQKIINAFTEAGLTIQKIRKTEDGFFVYHKYGMRNEVKRKSRICVEKGDTFRKYSVKTWKETINRDWIDNGLEYLRMTINEAKNRRGL